MNYIQRTQKHIQESYNGAKSIIDGISIAELDYYELKTFTSQLTQCVGELNQLLGAISQKGDSNE